MTNHERYTDMRHEEIETGVIILGAAYAAVIIGLIVWLTACVGW